MLGAHTNEWFTVNSEEVQQPPIFPRHPLNPNAPYISNPANSRQDIPFNGGLINGAGWTYTAESDTCKNLANTTLRSLEVSQGNTV